MSASFDHLLITPCATKRPPAVTSGKRGDPEAHLSNQLCTPLFPVTAEIALSVGLQTPHEVHQVFMDGNVDVREGDVLTVSSVDYPIKAVFDWPWRVTEKRKQLIITELKRKVTA